MKAWEDKNHILIDKGFDKSLSALREKEVE